VALLASLHVLLMRAAAFALATFLRFIGLFPRLASAVVLVLMALLPSFYVLFMRSTAVRHFASPWLPIEAAIDLPDSIQRHSHGSGNFRAAVGILPAASVLRNFVAYFAPIKT
jgi:hypothetical protein